MPGAFGGTRMALDHSLTHSLTHSILINLFIKVRLNTLLLPPLLSITFVPSAFYPYVWNILEGTSKANFFSRRINSVEMGFVLFSRSDWSEFWLNGSRPRIYRCTCNRILRVTLYCGKSVHNEPSKKICMFFFDY